MIGIFVSLGFLLMLASSIEVILGCDSVAAGSAAGIDCCTFAASGTLFLLAFLVVLGCLNFL
jgi:hypothetical protein